jgi:hypothetical protein
MRSVIRPSIKNLSGELRVRGEGEAATYRYCHPLQPFKPRICKTPAASNDPTMLLVDSAVQNHAKRSGSSFDLKKYVSHKTMSLYTVSISCAGEVKL